MREELAKYRLECFKLSYDINLKMGNIKSAQYFTRLDKTDDFSEIRPGKYVPCYHKVVLEKAYETEKEAMEDLKDVFSLSDMIFNYITKGLHPEDKDE